MSHFERLGSKTPCSRKIYTPQLMVMDISNKSVYAECRKKMQEAEAEMVFNVGVMSSKPFEKRIFSASLIHSFPRKGGSVTYGDVVMEYVPQSIPLDTMRIRLYIAYPMDKKEWYNEVCLQRAGLIGLMVQTFITVELSNFNNSGTNDLRPYIPFLDDCWTKQVAEIPMEDRTLTSGTHVSMSEPQFTEMTPSVAVLELDKTAVELDHERHLAKYIRRRLSLLGQLDANRLLHLVLLLSPQMAHGTVEKDKIETILDLSVVKSAAFHCMPTVASHVHRSLRDTRHANVLPTNRCWRVVSWLVLLKCSNLLPFLNKFIFQGFVCLLMQHKDIKGNKYTLKHTLGGIVACYLGAVVHEVGHLFKIPHTASGIMCNGGENIQTFFLPVKKINLGFIEKEFPQLQKMEGNTVDIHFPHELLVKRIMESLLDSTTKLLMTAHPLITHKPRRNMCPILYDEETGIVDVKSGVRYLVYYTNDSMKRIYSFTEQHMKKRLILKAKDSAVRALIVTSEGNFLSVLVTNTL